MTPDFLKTNRINCCAIGAAFKLGNLSFLRAY